MSNILPKFIPGMFIVNSNNPNRFFHIRRIFTDYPHNSTFLYLIYENSDDKEHCYDRYAAENELTAILDNKMYNLLNNAKEYDTFYMLFSKVKERYERNKY